MSVKKREKIACFGAPGSYSHEALYCHFGKSTGIVFYDHFEDLVNRVGAGECRYGVLPVENSSTGGIAEVYDLILRHNCHIVGEEYVHVQHLLLGVPGARMKDIRHVYSHPQGLAQCHAFLRLHDTWQLHSYFSTAQSAKEVAVRDEKSVAAIAGRQAAELYGLDVLAGNICTNTTNYTRFVIISKEVLPYEGNKMTLVIITEHVPGALYKALGYFYHSGMNMTHLESRPIPGRPFEYSFHIDVTGDLDSPACKEALEKLEGQCKYFNILGTYQAAENRL